METVFHDGRTTAYRATGFGSGPRVCHVHGAGGTHGVWVEQYGDRDGPPAVAVDLSGHGDSDDIDADPGTETVEAYADDVIAVCETTGASVLCGHSMGGAVALWVAAERDLDLSALVLADSGAKLGVDDGLLSTGPAVTLRDFRTCNDFDVRDRTGEVTVPTLALCGEYDRMTPPQFHEYLAAELPDCEYEEIPGAAHMSMLERPERFNEAVRSFLL